METHTWGVGTAGGPEREQISLQIRDAAWSPDMVGSSEAQAHVHTCVLSFSNTQQHCCPCSHACGLFHIETWRWSHGFMFTHDSLNLSPTSTWRYRAIFTA